jgi:hypothetical protein
MFGLEEKKKINKSAKKVVGKKSTQADEAKAMLASLEKKKKDKPDDCVFC